MCPRDGSLRPAVRPHRARNGQSSPPPEAPLGAREKAAGAVEQ